MRPVTATIHLNHLLYNYRLLHDQAGVSIMAVVKAEAYGHGLFAVAQALYAEGCRDFAVTDADEGARLRDFFQGEYRGERSNIVVLSGIFDENGAVLCKKYHLTPVLSEMEQLSLLERVQFHESAWLKVDTGMQRIGVLDVDRLLAQAESNTLNIQGVMSHLACADTPDHPLNQQQIERFQALQNHYPHLKFSLLNSAGIIAFSAQITTDIVRPGIALYGIEPIPSMPLGLKPVLQLRARVMQVRPIQAGESVSYGASWSADSN
ncbi:MAG: alanine racemase, partial [Ghiorsea sp.]